MLQGYPQRVRLQRRLYEINAVIFIRVKVLMRGELFQRWTHFLYCSVHCTVFGRKSKLKTDVTAWHGIRFHKNNLWNILVIWNYYVSFQNYQNLKLLTSSDTKRTLMHLFLFTNSTLRGCENLYQYVRIVYATAITFPCIITLRFSIFLSFYYSARY